MKRFPLLNFVEIKALAASIERALAGCRLERVFIPVLPEHPVGFFKQEWCFDFYSPTAAGQLFVSLRPQACGVFSLPAKTLRAAGQATRSGFDLGLVKHLEGSKLKGVRAIDNERILELKFASSDEDKSLLLYLIPSQPEAVLLQSLQNSDEVLNRTRESNTFTYPEGRALPSNQQFSVNPAYGSQLEHYPSLFLQARTNAAIELRRTRIEKAIREQNDYWKKKRASYQEQLDHQGEEEKFFKYGSLLQAQMYAKPKLIKGMYTLQDYETGVDILVPGDAKLDLKRQVEYYFHQAKRARTRTQEATARLRAAEEKLQQLNALQARVNAETFEEIEAELGLKAGSKPVSKTVAQFSGKHTVSAEGLSILIGRNSAENMELFKLARGNDVWMHVKGRPGSHVIVLIPPKRSASLETLLDAANLCIHYSGGKDWGKTDVDYTFKKYLKKIKNQTDVSYSQNKTLTITPDGTRIKRLLGSD